MKNPNWTIKVVNLVETTAGQVEGGRVGWCRRFESFHLNYTIIKVIVDNNISPYIYILI